MKALLLLVSLVIISTCAAVQIRFIHAVADGPPCDIYIDNQLAFANVEAYTVTAYVDFPYLSFGSESGVLVEIYHTGTQTSYFDSMFTGVFFLNDTVASSSAVLYGSYKIRSSDTPLWATGFHEINAVVPHMSLLRCLFLGPTFFTELHMTISRWNSWTENYSPVAALHVPQHLNNAYSLLQPQEYMVTIMDASDQMILCVNITLEEGKSYSLIAFGNTTTSPDYPYPLSVTLATDLTPLSVASSSESESESETEHGGFRHHWHGGHHGKGEHGWHGRHGRGGCRVKYYLKFVVAFLVGVAFTRLVMRIRQKVREARQKREQMLTPQYIPIPMQYPFYVNDPQQFLPEQQQ